MRWSFPLSLKWPAFECTVPRVSRRSRAKSIFTCIIIFSMVGRWRKPNVLTVLYEEQIGQLTSQSCESGNVHLQTWIFALFTTPRGYIASFLAPSHSRYGTCTVNHNNTLVSAGRFLYSSFIVRLINCPFSHSHSWLAVFIVSPTGAGGSSRRDDRRVPNCPPEPQLEYWKSCALSQGRDTPW